MLPIHLTRSWLLSALLGLVLTAATATAAPNSAMLPGWDASVESNAEQIDHSAWQRLLDVYLKTHPSGINRFDYAALKADAKDTARLAGYLTALQALDPRHYARAEQKAYWLNFYNALTVQIVVDAYPVDSIRNIHQGWLPLSGPWNDVHTKVAGQPLTLNNIEHGILRPIWRDKRIHYAVNCASYGCPNLRPILRRCLRPRPVPTSTIPGAWPLWTTISWCYRASTTGMLRTSATAKRPCWPTSHSMPSRGLPPVSRALPGQ